MPSDADVVNAHDWPALRAGRIAARRLNVPLVWTRNNEVTAAKASGMSFYRLIAPIFVGSS